MEGYTPLFNDPYAEAFRRIWQARRAGRPVPSIDELLPQRELPLLTLVVSNSDPEPEAVEQVPRLRLVSSR